LEHSHAVHGGDAAKTVADDGHGPVLCELALGKEAEAGLSTTPSS
jgi:hypothetical protein